LNEASLQFDQIRERDLDLVLLAALFISEPFRAFVLKCATGWNKGHSLVQARVSETADAGETDLLLVVDLDDADRLARIMQPMLADVA